MNAASFDAAGGSADAMAKTFYQLGSTPVVSCRADPRFSYCLFVPDTLRRGRNSPELVVVQHGTARGFIGYRDAFAAFGRWNDCIILAPLFPAGVLGDGNRDGFKYLSEGSVRYDQILLSMVAEVGESHGLAFDRFALFGYSGGGQFTHRFLMLHPDRLWAASIGAPGSVTLLDPTRDWWIGTRDMAERFGAAPNVGEIKKVPVQMIVGAADLETWEITHLPGGRHWMPDANHAGATRPERLASLRRSFEAACIHVRFDLLPNLAHDEKPVIPVVEDFFSNALALRRSARKNAP